MKRVYKIITIWLIVSLFLLGGTVFSYAADASGASAASPEPVGLPAAGTADAAIAPVSEVPPLEGSADMAVPPVSEASYSVDSLSTLEGGPIAAAGSTDVAQTFTSSDTMTWYVRGIKGALKEAAAYAGSDPVPVEHFGNLGEGDGPAPKTLILVDNSLSIGNGKGNADKIKAILTRLIWNHQPMERFALKTFSDHAETVIDYTNNYDAVRQAVEGLTYHDQDTYLRNVLYDEIMKLSQDGEDDYSRIIVISDGTEDSRMGITYEELIALLKDEAHRLPVYTIGFKYDPAVGDLDKLFSLSRQTHTPSFWAEDYEDPAVIADGINADANNVSYFEFSFPPQLRTGDIRAITLGTKSTEGDYYVVHTMALPTAAMTELEALQAQRKELEEERARQNERIEELQSELAAEPWLMVEEESETYADGSAVEAPGYAAGAEAAAAEPETEPATEPETEPEAEPESASEEPGEEEVDDVKLAEIALNEYTRDFLDRNLRSGVLILIGVVLLSLIGLIIYGDRTRRKKKDFKELELPPETEEQVPDPDAALTRRIILIDMAQPDSQYTIDLGKTKILGRSRAHSDIAFPDDRSMASRQARIYFEFGTAYIENLDTLGTTSLNGTVVNGSEELISGSVLQIGDTRLRIKYE